MIVGAENLSVKLRSGRKKEVASVYLTPTLFKKDLAIIDLKGKQYPVISLASEEPQLDDKINAIGHPHGHYWTLSKGYVAGFRKEHGEKVIQTNASISPGNSGGPMCNAKGEAIGVSSYLERRRIKWKDGTFTIDPSEVLKFGISVKEVISFKRNLKDYKTVTPSQLTKGRDYAYSLTIFGKILVLTHEYLMESNNSINQSQASTINKSMQTTEEVVTGRGLHRRLTERTTTRNVKYYGVEVGDDIRRPLSFFKSCMNNSVKELFPTRKLYKSLQRSIYYWNKCLSTEYQTFQKALKYESQSYSEAKNTVHRLKRKHRKALKNMYLSLSWIKSGIEKHGAYYHGSSTILPVIKNLERKYKSVLNK